MLNRKSKPVLQINKNGHSSSSSKLYAKPSHLLSKPYCRKKSCSKQTQSHSTLNSQNMSKSSTCKLKSHNSNPNQKQLANLLKIAIGSLDARLSLLKDSAQLSGQEWYRSVEMVCKDIPSSDVKLLVLAIQKGYHCWGSKPSSAVPAKKPAKLGLNIAKINKQQILDYHDEFMSKIEEYSPSWRALLQSEQKRRS